MAGVHRQGRRDPLDRESARRALELPESDRLPDGAEPARGQTQLRFGHRPHAGNGRSGRAAVCRPVPGHATPAVQQPRSRLSGPRLSTGSDGWRRPGAADAHRPNASDSGFEAAARSSTSSTSSVARSTTPRLGGMDDVYRRAFDVLTSDKVAKALGCHP